MGVRIVHLDAGDWWLCVGDRCAYDDRGGLSVRSAAWNILGLLVVPALQMLFVLFFICNFGLRCKGCNRRSGFIFIFQRG